MTNPHLQYWRTHFPSIDTMGDVTVMELSDPHATPNVTMRLLQWPACLIGDLNYTLHAELYTADIMQQLLDTQSQSLQHIALGIIPGDPTGIPNFAFFTQLRTL